MVPSLEDVDIDGMTRDEVRQAYLDAGYSEKDAAYYAWCLTLTLEDLKQPDGSYGFVD